VIVVETYRDRTVGVFGLGASGLSAARALEAGGAQVLAWDDVEARRDAAARAARLSLDPPDAWSDFSALVLSPGVPLTHPEPHPVVRLARHRGAEVIGDVELFARARAGMRVVSITGTNGKSTTTALIGHLLSSAGMAAATGANLGRPVLDLEPLAEDGVYVLELSSYQIDLTRSLRPAVAVLLNLSPDHLDRHGGMAGYIAAKRRLFEMADRDAILVVGVDDDDCRQIADAMLAAGRGVVPIAVGRQIDYGFYVVDGIVHRADGKRRDRIASLRGIESLRGTHNWQNAAAAVAVALSLGVDAAAIQRGLRSFPGLAHRMQRLAEIDGVGFVNDSKATNADAAARALAAFDRIYWIAGGLPKAGGIAGLTAHFPRIARAYLIGAAATEFARTLDGKVPFELSGDLVTAVRSAYRDASAAEGAGRTVLLSPACASFDQFANFEARGEAFARLVAALAEARREDAG
jgi:UDP-N-acetylmuramoylalanine--D-glutamate ligase